MTGSVALRTFQEKIFNEINGLLVNNLLNATEPDRLPSSKMIVERVSDREPMADAIVVFTPMAHHELASAKSFERGLNGRIEKLEKGKVEPKVIVHKANTIISSLEAGVPVRMYLKRFDDRDAYYPIGIFAITSGVK